MNIKLCKKNTKDQNKYIGNKNKLGQLLKIIYFKDENEIDLIDKLQYYKNISSNVKILKGIKNFDGYKMYEYPSKGVYVIDKISNSFSDEGCTYIFPEKLYVKINDMKDIFNILDNQEFVQKNINIDNYCESLQEKIKRAELQELLIEEKELQKLTTKE